MAKTTTCPITQSIQSPNPAQILNGTGNNGTSIATTNPSNTLLVFTAGAEGSKITSLIVSSDDTSARVLSFWISNDGGTTKYHLFSVSIPATSGQTGTLAVVDILGSAYVLGMPLDQSGKPVMPLAASARLYVGSQTTVTSGKAINVQPFGEDF